jgi:2-polyprenyl-3-methyl-5-hydroxy-6-metoxy-1,4-benzoquinol methylase
MDRIEYIAKLKQFNSKEKYFIELDFITGLIKPHFGKKVVDYGCGVGTMVKWLKNTTTAKVYGYDVVNYVNVDAKDKPKWFIDDASDIPECDTVYFFHSFAHIPNIANVLFELREKVQTKVVVITPNRQWLDLQVNENYIPDPTVVRHYTHDELIEIFEDTGYKIHLSGGFGFKTNNQYERLFLVAKP